jgi:nitrate/nitrite-specific signal transduction histidine kinase
MHSEARRVDVELRYGEDFVLCVTDNGKGISPEIVDKGRQGHFGLRGMRERAARIGGKFTLVTSPTSGTQITLQIPGILISNKADITRPARLARLRALFVRTQQRESRD